MYSFLWYYPNYLKSAAEVLHLEQFLEDQQSQGNLGLPWKTLPQDSGHSGEASPTSLQFHLLLNFMTSGEWPTKFCELFVLDKSYWSLLKLDS